MRSSPIYFKIVIIIRAIWKMTRDWSLRHILLTQDEGVIVVHVSNRYIKDFVVEVTILTKHFTQGSRRSSYHTDLFFSTGAKEPTKEDYTTAEDREIRIKISV